MTDPAFKLLSDRVPYSAIVDRPPLKGPDGARVLLWLIVNVEHWSIERAMPRTVLSPPMGQPLLPDLPNWSWHEFGMRVGFWRILSALDKRKIRPTMAINGVVCSSYPRIASAARDLNWEFMGHGFVQGPMHKVEDQPAAIAQTIQAIKSFTGKHPRGWESPGLTETDATIDHLSAAGVDYVADWILDEQPCYIMASPKPVISVPYTVEVNDIPVFGLQNHRSDEFYHRGVAQLDRLIADGAESTRVMAVSVHAYLTGVPHRIAGFEKLLDYIQSRPEVKIMTGEDIADWYRGQVPPPNAR